MMKKSTKTIGTRLKSVSLWGMMGLFIQLSTACMKNDTTTSNTSYLSIINASPTLGTFNIYLDDTQLNTGAIAFGGILSYVEYTAGDHTTKFTTASSTDALLSKTITLSENTVYSYFAIDKGENLDGLLVKDVVTVASTEKAFIRFIHLSPDTKTLDFAIEDKGNLISNISYKGASEFIAVDPGTFNLQLKDHDTQELKTSLSENTLTAGKYYTIISRGLQNAAGNNDQPFSAQLITNL